MEQVVIVDDGDVLSLSVKGELEKKLK